ncbi:putative arabinose efflux permease, MFS family [Promicromonospora umidemergens]|uniref:MFS transporter n=1 Tax=Promicromonospora umidemergens TaxID=629679 RepID=A0ABP8WDN0_9MICO|nr:MFS transporter [Promicromonospora umidemergens]MCP2285980.1 putative arabinose efflux permease, MFS family [Promicromonospora umidemergens]
MLRVLSHPVYRRLFTAQVVALLGTGLATVALALVAYDLNPDNAAGVLGTALAIKMVANVVVAPLAVAAVARLPRKWVLIGADLLRLVVAASLPFVGEVWQVYVLIFVMQAASATFTPTFQSVIPDILKDEDDYTVALSLSRLAYDLESILAPVFAAVLLLLVPSSTLFFGTAIGFAGSALLVVAAVIPRRGGESSGERPQLPFGNRARRGAELFVRTRALRPVLLLNLAVAAAGAFVLVQTVVIVRTTFGQGEDVVPLLLATSGLGSMVAAFALPLVLRRVPERRVMLTGAVALTAAVALVPFALSIGRSVWGLVAVGVLWVLVGLGWSTVETPVGRIIRRNVPAADLSDVFAAQFSLSHACWLITYPLAGWLGATGLSSTALVLAGVAGAATLGAVRLWPAKEPRDAVAATASRNTSPG